MTTTRSPRSSCVPKAMPRRTATSGVTSTLTMPATPSRENSWRRRATPRSGSGGSGRRPRSSCTGRPRTSGPIKASSPTTHSSPSAAPSSTRTRARGGRSCAHDGAREDGRRRPMCVPPSIIERSTEAPGLDRHVRAEHGVRPDARALLDPAVVAEEGRPLDDVDLRQRHALAEPDVLLEAHARARRPRRARRARPGWPRGTARSSRCPSSTGPRGRRSRRAAPASSSSSGRAAWRSRTARPPGCGRAPRARSRRRRC